MKHILSFVALVALAFFAACGSDGVHAAGGKDSRARIVGTVIDAATGAPVANVKVEGPEGRKARSDAQGRFELEDLEVGTQGEVKATADDGRKARITLRRLAPGRLEVVLQLTAR